MEYARRRHVEEKPIAAPAGPTARLAPWLPTNVLRHDRSILYFSKDLPRRCGLGNLAQRRARREVPERRHFEQLRCCGGQLRKRDFSGTSGSLIGWSADSYEPGAGV
jgi:hypothetical protein